MSIHFLLTATHGGYNRFFCHAKISSIIQLLVIIINYSILQGLNFWIATLNLPSDLVTFSVIMQILSLLASGVTILVAGSIHIFHDSINVYFMGFFRDLARIKARKRRMRNNMAITSTKNDDKFTKSELKMLFFKQEKEDPLKDVEFNLDIDEDGKVTVLQKNSNDNASESYPDIDLAEYTREELFELGDGDNEEGVILLSIFGRVYDVSDGWKHYGEGGKYHKFAGRDVTRALSTGCLTESCLGSMVPSPTGVDSEKFELSNKTINEGKKWVSFFETHDSYKLVGVLKDSISMDEMIDKQIQTSEEEEIEN